MKYPFHSLESRAEYHHTRLYEYNFLQEIEMQRPTEITVDLSSCENEASLFEYLWRQLNFPSLYQMSWQGLCENMFYDPELRMPDVLTVKGFGTFSRINPSSAKDLETVFADYDLSEPDRIVLYED